MHTAKHILNGDNWSGELLVNNNATQKLKVTGSVNGHAWLLTVTKRITLEIADDFSIDSADLPLVGFGCNGWLVERNIEELDELDALAESMPALVSDNFRDLTALELSLISTTLKQLLDTWFNLFQQESLPYLLAVSSSCRD